MFLVRKSALGKQRLWETEKGLDNCGSEYGRFKR